MPKEKTLRGTPGKSILYLTLLCLLFYLASIYGGSPPYPVHEVKSAANIYVEVEDGGAGTVHILKTPSDVAEFSDKYGVDRDIENGVKIVLNYGSANAYGRISGLRSISLGVPIGINSAGPADLAALPGIGEELAARIISYREEKGGFASVSELLDVRGIGGKKFAAISGLVSLD